MTFNSPAEGRRDALLQKRPQGADVWQRGATRGSVLIRNVPLMTRRCRNLRVFAVARHVAEENPLSVTKKCLLSCSSRLKLVLHEAH